MKLIQRRSAKQRYFFRILADVNFKSQRKSPRKIFKKFLKTITSGTKLRLGNMITILKVIGKGGFGKVYSGFVNAKKRNVALKFQQKCRESFDTEIEASTVMKGKLGFPTLLHFSSRSAYDVLVYDLLGENIHELSRSYGKPIHIKSVCMLAIQCLDRIEAFHESGFIHRDIKPHNFVVGPSNSDTRNVIHLIDFGVATKYVDDKGNHIPFRCDVEKIGTYIYESLNAHAGIEQSRRDDLESLGYMILELFLGILPWDKSDVEINTSYEDYIIQMKNNLHLEIFSESIPLLELEDYFRYVRSLDFMETPKYDNLRKLFDIVLKTNHYVNDNIFEWS